MTQTTEPVFNDRAIPAGSLVLVTGATGFVGSHVADQLLKYGYRVRAPARNPEKAAKFTKLFEARHGPGKFSVVPVADVSAAGALTAAVEGCAAVVHLAQDMTFKPDPDDVIPPALQATRNALEAAASEPNGTVKRFVFVSSSHSAVFARPGDTHAWGPDHYNEEAVRRARDRDFPSTYVATAMNYGASKVLSEKLCFDFVRDTKPSFDVTTVVPNFNIGSFLVRSEWSSSCGLVMDAYEGDQTALSRLQNVLVGIWFIDPVDTALLLIAPLVFADVKGRRLLGFSEPINYNKLCRLIKEVGGPDHPAPPQIDGFWEGHTNPDTSYSVELLKRFGRPGFKGLEESFRDAVATRQNYNP